MTKVGNARTIASKTAAAYNIATRNIEQALAPIKPIVYAFFISRNCDSISRPGHASADYDDVDTVNAN